MGHSKRGKSLKASLVGHQKRQMENVVAAKKQAALKDKGKSKSQVKKGVQEKRFTIPFVEEDKILLIGEGNFSFAHSLLGHTSVPHLPPSNITATAYDTEQVCLSKYPDADTHISALRNAGATVLFGVDATKLEKTFKKGEQRWDKVIWNFPHVGMGIADVERNVVANQKVLLGFLKSVAGVLEEGVVVGLSTGGKGKGKSKRKESEREEVGFSDEDGEMGGGVQLAGPKRAGSVLITLREQEPYTLWDVPRLAKKPIILEGSSSRNVGPQPRYLQLRSFAFHAEAYPGYGHRRTTGWRENEHPLVGTASRDERGPSRTWEFVLRPEDHSTDK